MKIDQSSKFEKTMLREISSHSQGNIKETHRARPWDKLGSTKLQDTTERSTYFQKPSPVLNKMLGSYFLGRI